jgi:hypothetical protein
MELDWENLVDTVCEILHTVYVKDRRAFRAIAQREGTSKESLAAAAICGMLREILEVSPFGAEPSLN